MSASGSGITRAPRVRPGDTIRIVAPSGPVPKEEFEAGLFALGGRYRVVYDPQVLYAVEGYLAGPDEQRLDALNEAIRDPSCRAILMARGGYGLLRILPFIDLEALRAHPKPIVGFSDGTALLAAAARAGVAAVHGPVLTQLGKLPFEDRDALLARLENPEPQPILTGLDDLIPGRVQGPLLGGNLEVLSRLVGTPFVPDLDGAILFIEDIGERPYRVDRLITHLDLAGVWSAVVGVVVGDFTNCVEPENTRFPSPSVAEVLEERLGRLPIPVAFGARVGHADRNLALPYGTLCELDTRTGTLVALEGVVS